MTRRLLATTDQIATLLVKTVMRVERVGYVVVSKPEWLLVRVSLNPIIFHNKKVGYSNLIVVSVVAAMKQKEGRRSVDTMRNIGHHHHHKT